MSVKKVFVMGAALAMTVGLLAGTASAHHGQGGGCRQSWKCSIPACTVEDCHEAGRHIHDGVVYTGSGLEKTRQIALCPMEGCEETGRHVHDGITYCGYAHGCGYCDGSCQIALCPVEGCEETGRHVHDGIAYCGYAHTGGWCDGSGSCQASTSNGCVPVYGGHHHGRHH